MMQFRTPLRSAPFVLACVLAIAACAKKEASAEGGGEAQVQAVVGARTAVAVRRSVRETVGGISTVVARPGHSAQLSAPAVSRVARVYVSAGQQVQAGAPLIAFDRAPLDAQAAAATTALATAQRSLERAKRLVDAGIAPRKDLDQATSEVARANADAVAAERMQQHATLTAPISGVVTRMNATLGATVDPAQPLIEVADLSSLDLTMPIPPEAAARVHRGQTVDITTQASGDPEPLGTATIADIGGTIDSTTRAVEIRAPITHQLRQLRIGETVFARIVLAAHANAVTVPTEALVPEGDSLKVFVVDASHIAHARPVTVGVRDAGVAEITSGLEGGETVVTYGAYGVQDSAKVTSTTEPAASTSIPADTAKP